MEVSLDMSALTRFTRRFGRIEARGGGLIELVDKEREIQEFCANLLIQEIAERAPKKTRRYSRSYTKRYAGRVNGYIVSTTSPQARRLEYGFYGTDSLGRNYNQAPRPHVRPAVAEVRPIYNQMYRKMIRDSWRGTT